MNNNLDIDLVRNRLPVDWPSLSFINSINPGNVDAHFYSTQFSYLCYIALYQFAASFCEGADVLDAACGLGFGSRLLAETANHVTGIDLVPEDISFATLNYPNERTRFLTMDATATTFKDGQFDRIISLETFEHIPPEKEMVFLGELKRLLKPGGLLILSTPNREVYSRISRTPDHVNELNVDEMKIRLEPLFEEIIPFYQRKDALKSGAYYAAARKDRWQIRKLAPKWLKRIIRKIFAVELERTPIEILESVQVCRASQLSDVEAAVFQVWVCRKEI